MKIRAHQTEIKAEDVSTNELELTISTVISPDDVFDLLDELPGHHFNQVAVRFTEDNGTVAYMLQSMDEENRVQAIYDGIENTDDFVALLKKLDQKDRNEIFGHFCRHCGSTDKPCWCMCDD